MAKQILESAEVKNAVSRDNKIAFENSFWHIKTVKDAINYLESLNTQVAALLELPKWSFEYKVAAYCTVVYALTHNEKRHLITGERCYPTIEFCRSGKLENCYGDTIVGRIETEGKTFYVVGGSAYYGAHAGLGDFDPVDDVSAAWTPIAFRSVNSKEIAEYISKQFGRLLFEVTYGGVNCDWEWID